MYCSFSDLFVVFFIVANFYLESKLQTTINILLLFFCVTIVVVVPVTCAAAEQGINVMDENIFARRHILDRHWYRQK